MKANVLAARTFRALAGLVLVLLGFAGFFAFAASFVDYPALDEPERPSAWIRGAYHVHTTRSDGRGTPSEVARAAKAAGLDFVVLTDHNDFTPRTPEWIDGVLMIPGVELSTTAGHLAALGLKRPLDGAKAWMPPDAAVSAVEAAGGMSVLAHPVQRRNPWRDEETARRVPGFELYSADTFLRQALRSPVSRLLPAVGASFTHPVHGVMLMVAPEPEPMARFMDLSREKPRLALCAHDAHGLPSYEHVFRAMAMALPPQDVPRPLPKDASEAAERVVLALTGGNAVCAFRALGEPEGFALDGLDSGGREARVGDVLTVRLPERHPDTVEVRVWGDGRLRDATSVELTGPGVVQVEVWVRAPGRFFGSEWRPWIVPSPVRVLPRGPGI
ncbi:CehA/McbA family metallohydrolase [Myxococcaceae bacterium JPH2]|nr:CehA/McbA family metallohydrolase [Myxococcaceae bacterium JPH2]